MSTMQRISSLSPAGSALNLNAGFGLGSNLSQQVADETDEEKKKRLLGMSALQSPAGQALLSSPYAR
jgi:hypothetical protein